jgi:hypothetical protein
VARASTTKSDGKRERPRTPLSKDFGDSEFSKEHFSFEGDDSPLMAPLSLLSDYSDDSMGLSMAERAYIRPVKRVGLEGSDDSKEENSSEDSEGEDSEEEDSGSGDGSGYDGGSSSNGGGAGGCGASDYDDNGYDDGDESGGGKGDVGKGGGGNVGGGAPPA